MSAERRTDPALSRNLKPPPFRRWSIHPALAVVLGVRSARQGIPATRALPAFLQSYLTNLVTAAVRLIRLGQTDGQLAVAQL
jgi:urease accessory protein